MNSLKKKFAPEFLNRIDEVIIFNSLSKENIHQIIDIELSKLYLKSLLKLKKLQESGFCISTTKPPENLDLILS